MTLTHDGAIRENHVVEFEEGRRIAWRPAEAGKWPPGHLWRWELKPASASRTRVTCTYDWTQLTDQKRFRHLTVSRPSPKHPDRRRHEAATARQRASSSSLEPCPAAARRKAAGQIDPSGAAMALSHADRTGKRNGGYSRGCRGAQGGVIRGVPMRP